MGPTDRAVSDGRAPDGRFTVGNRGGPGNPHARRMRELRQALLDAVPAERVARVAAKLADLAEAGDVQAAKVLLDHAVGKPPAAVEITGAEGESLGLDLPRVYAAILGALARFPEARLAVVASLRGLADAGDDRAPDDGPGPEPPA